MKPGSVLVDISIDQGGCFEDSRPTTHADPTYQVHDSVFYCVANMPGAVPHTSHLRAHQRDPARTPSSSPTRAGSDALAGRPRAGARAEHPRRRTSPTAPVAEAHRAWTAVALDEVLPEPEAPRGRRRPAAPPLERAVDAAGWTTSTSSAARRANTLSVLPARPRRVPAYLAGRASSDPEARHARRDVTRVPRLAARGGRRAPAAGRRPRPPAPWSRSAGSTGSCARGGRRPPTRPRGVSPPTPPIAAAEGDPRRGRRAAARGGVGRRHAGRRCATAPCSRCSTAPARASPRRSASTSTTSTSGRRASVRLLGKGGKERVVPLGSLRARRRSTATWSGRARSSAAQGHGHARAVPQPARRPAVPAERLGGAAGGRRAGRPRRPRLAAHAAALVRHPPARRRRRRAGRAGAARARLGDHDADLHAGHGRSACARSMPRLTRGPADRVPQACSARVLTRQTAERAPVTAEANPQVSTSPTAEHAPSRGPAARHRDRPASARSGRPAVRCRSSPSRRR